jgi:putative ABC transport system substrate-binding protein
MDRLPVLAAHLVSRRVAVIAAAGGPPVVLAAKAATTTIPVVFVTGDDPIRLGYVTNLARPESNLTGISFFNAELAAKRLALLRELVPRAARVAVLVNPAIGAVSEATLKDLEGAARTMGIQLQVLTASNSHEINAAFEGAFERERPDALFVGPGSFFLTRRVQLAHLTTRYSIPAVYSERDYVEVGGLMGYGASLTEAYRQMGVYAGSILRGAQPTELPVLRASKFELVLNAETARMLRLAIPPTLLVIADEVIE